MSHADLSVRQRRAARVRLAELIAVRRSQRDRDRVDARRTGASLRGRRG